MLTSIYYYDFYKPYILNADNKKNVQKSRFSGIKSKEYIQNGSKESSSYFLNHADKNEIKSFVLNVSDNVNGIKDTVRFLNNVANGKNARRDEGKSAYGDGLEDFVEDYNSLASFSDNNNVSQEIKAFKNSVERVISDNNNILKDVGVSIDGDILEFDRSLYEDISNEEYKEKSAVLNNVFSDIYNDAINVLSKPMASHLNFKNLDFYYNYSFASKDMKPFQLLESGLIVDITL